MDAAVRDAASGNRKELLEELLIKPGVSMYAAVFGAAEGNRTELLEELLTRSRSGHKRSG